MTLANLKVIFRFFNKFFGLPPLRQAMLIQLLEPDINIGHLAAVVGIDRRTLAKSGEFQRIRYTSRILLRMPLGTINDQGFIEAYLTEPD